MPGINIHLILVLLELSASAEGAQPCYAPDIKGAKISPSKYQYYPYERIIVECKEGYHLTSGGSYRALTCYYGGRWEGEMPVCEGEQCPNLFIRGATLSPKKDTYHHPDHVVVDCEKGYRRTLGDSYLQCSSRGQWEGRIPICAVESEESRWPACAPDQHMCPDTGKCIKKEYICDGYTDCYDRSDENICTSSTVCPSYEKFGEQIPCVNNSGCINRYYLCDGRNDCPGGEDEDKCDEHRCYEGITHYFTCQYFADCFLLSDICSGKDICRTGRGLDVKLPVCDTFSCPSGYFKCKNGNCVRDSQVCDGHHDNCGDASDEANCTFSCAGQCNKSTPKYRCGCNIACRIDNSCCHDYEDVCSAPSTCTDLVNFKDSSMIDLTPPSPKDGLPIRGVVLQDSANGTDDRVYVVSPIYGCKPANFDGCNEYSRDCTRLVIYESYSEMKNDSFSAMSNLSVSCFINTVRIYNGHLYCHVAQPDVDRYGRDYMVTYILKIDPSDGAILNRRKVDVHSDNLCNKANYNNDQIIVDYLIDSTGFWLYYKSRTTQKYVLELITPDDLGTMQIIQGDHLQPSEFSTKNPVFMICGKLYEISLTSDFFTVTKAVDVFSPENVYDAVTSIGSNVISLSGSDIRLIWLFMHYNPATNEIFTSASTFNTGDKISNFKLSPQTCKFPFVNITRLSSINSTFLWSLTQTETPSLRQMVTLLTGYFELTDPVLLADVSDMLLTCPDTDCYDKSKSNSLYCIIERAIIDLQLYADHKQVSKSSTVALQTAFHMKELLQQQFNREIASQINDLKLHMSHSFEELKQTVISLQNNLQTKLSNYYSSLAKYDQKKAEADVNFVYGRLEKYKKSIEDSSNTLAGKLSDLFVDAIGSASANIIGKTRRVVFASLAVANPVDKILGRMDSILTLMDAIDELMRATVDLHRAIHVKGVLPKINEETNALRDQLEKNMKTQTHVRHMIVSGFEKNLNIDNTSQYMDGFLKEYNDYSPVFTAGMFANYEAMLDGVIDELCDVIFSGDTTEAGIAQHIIVSKGSCLNIKNDVARLIATYEEMYDFQFDLMEAMASYVRAAVAQAGAQKLAETIDGALSESEREENELALQVHTLQMYTVNNVHMNMVVQDACNLITYQKGEETPAYCHSLLIDAHTAEFDKLVAYPYETDMCAHDSIKKYVDIPAKLKTNAEDKLPTSVIDLDELYNGKKIEFQVPNSYWLVQHRWLNELDILKPLFISQFQLFLPPLHPSPPRATEIHMIVDMDGDNYITEGGTKYTFSTPVQYNFRYTHGSKSCFSGQYLDTAKHPYNVLGCPDRKDAPCITSEGKISGAVFHPSVFARWRLRAHITGNLTQPRPPGEMNLRAGMTFCKVGLTRRIRDQTGYSQPLSNQVCCSDINKYHNDASSDHPCQDCPSGSCPNLHGFYCETNCTIVQS